MTQGVWADLVPLDTPAGCSLYFPTLIGERRAAVKRENMYRPYRLTEVRPQTGGVEALVNGPGIPETGVRYWFVTEPEAQTFLENLNFSYNEAKQLASWRKQGSKNGRGSFRSPFAVLAH
jgi:hypothetical protein